MFPFTIKFNKPFIEACYIPGTLLPEMLDTVKKKKKKKESLTIKKLIEWGTDKSNRAVTFQRHYLLSDFWLVNCWLLVPYEME